MSGFVEHGRTIWQVALLALVGLGALWAHLGPVVRRQGRAWVARRRVGRARSGEGLADGMVVTLVGELRARGPHCALTGEAARTVLTGRDVTHLRTSDVLLAVEAASSSGEVLVELAGPIEVALGSGESTARVAEQGGRARVRTRVVRPGDRVLARGVVQACAGDAPGVGYRTAAHRFRLVAERAGAPLRVVAAGASRTVAPRGLALLRGATVGALLFAVLFVAGGAAARHAARSAGPSDPALRPGWGLSAASLAAATPFHRATVFEVVGAALRERPREALVEATLALATANEEDCTAATRALVRAGELRRGAERGEACRAPAARREAARAYLALAEYDAADAVLRDLAPTLDGEDRARALVAQVLGSSPSPWTVRDEDRCLLVSAAAATGGLGTDFARDQLRRALRDGGPTRRTCALLLARHLSGRDRDEVLAGTVAADDLLATLVRLAEDPGAAALRPEPEASALLRDDVLLLTGASLPGHALAPALERAILERELSSGASSAAWARRAWLAGDVATVASLAGDHERARIEVARALRAARQGAHAPLEDLVHALGAAIEWRADDAVRAAAHLEHVPADHDLAGAVGALAAAPRQPRPSGASLLLPLLASAVDPLLHLVVSSRQLDLARAFDDGPQARELEQTVARLYAVLSRADLALPAALVPPRQR